MRCVASSSAWVVACNWLTPTRRSRRFRKSSRLIRMKTVRISTKPNIPMGARKGGQFAEINKRAGLRRHHLHGKWILRSSPPACAARVPAEVFPCARQLLADGRDIFLDPAQRSGGGRPESLNFVMDVFAVRRQMVHYVDQFIRDHPAHRAGQRDDGDHHDDDGRNSSEVEALKPIARASGSG